MMEDDNLRSNNNVIIRGGGGELCNKCGLGCYLTEYGQHTTRTEHSPVTHNQCAVDTGQTYMERAWDVHHVYVGGSSVLGQFSALHPPPPRLRVQNGLLLPEPLNNKSSFSKSSSSASLSHFWWHTGMRWLTANKLLTVVMAMLTLTTILPFVWCRQIHQEASYLEEEIQPVTQYYEGDEKLGRFVRSLQALQANDESKLQQQRALTDSITKAKFPWLVRENVLPNFFLHDNTEIQRKGIALYRNSPIVFLHHHRAAGSAIMECLQNISQKFKLGLVHDWSSDSRALWESKKKETRASDYRIHTGQYSFGICGGSSKCSHFMFLRDPMERAVSSYHFCQQVGLRSDQEMCRVVDANDVSLRDWILLQGSLTFQQFLYNYTWCDDPTPQPGSYALDGTDIRVAPSKQWPCWLKQRVHVDTLSVSDKTHLLDYILQNMESWFSMIGLTNDMNNSLIMLDKVYDLPFSGCSGLKRSKDKYFDPHDNRSNRKKHKDGYYDDNDPHYLKYDYFVRKALHADYEIYKKAQSIYRLQKQMIFNTL